MSIKTANTIHWIKCANKYFPFGIKNTLTKNKPMGVWEELFEIKKSWDNLNLLISLFEKQWVFKTNSLASASLLIFDKFFNNCKITVKENPKKTDEIFRKGYSGGRVEVFGNSIGSEKTVFFDFPSMYGNVMQEEFPYGYYTEIDNPKDITKNGLYLVSVKSEKMYAPVLPVVIGTRPISFMNGDFEGWYYKEELELFVENKGIIKEIKKGIIFEKTEKIFKNFSETFLKLREENTFNKKVCKSIIVSIYGRLGMGDYEKKTQIVKNETEYEHIEKTHEITSETWINDHCGIIEFIYKEEKKDQKTTINSNVLYAGYITAKARIKLYRAMKEVWNTGGRVLYIDTDCIFAAFDKKKNIKSSDFKLIKWENKKIINSAFASTKMYSLKYRNSWETRICGIPINSIKFEEFYSMFYENKEEKKKINIELSKVSPYQFYSKKMEKFIDLNCYKKREFTLAKKETKPFKILNGMILKDEL